MTSQRSGARKTVTVLFCDLTGSTSLGERLDPETLRELIDRYFAEMRSVVERHGGTIEKFIGDAVMAVFGVPRVHEDDALRAVRSAADMQAALTTANEGFEQDFGVRIQARIGVNTGEVIAGDPSSGESFVSGDAVNVAARLEQAAEPGDVLLGASTYRLVRAAVVAEPLPPIPAKGKSEALAAYRLIVLEQEGEMLPRRLDAPLAGRADELAVLRRAFDEVAGSSTGALVTLIGEAGLGKSRLALELVRAVSGEARVLRGRCLPYGEGITFWPVREVLEEAAGIEPGDPPEEAMAKIGSMLAPEHRGLTERLGALLGIGGTAGAIQETFLAVRKALESAAAGLPLVIVFDDVQWGEEAFLDLVQYLATFAGGRPLLLLCLARPELLEARPDWTRLGPTVALKPLDAHDGATLIENLLGRSALELAARIVEASAGNPLFIEEMLRMLVDQGVVARDGTGWTITGEVARVGAPETVQAVIAARLDRLDPEERETIQIASVVGEVFWWSAVADLADASPLDVARGLQSLVRKDLIRPDPSSLFSDDAFRFGHLLIRDGAYESLPKKARALMHERFAGWVERRAGDRSAEYDEIIGYHAESAHRYLTELGPPDERSAALALVAAERLASAGERNFEGGDLPGSAALLARAVALLGPEHPSRPRLALLLGDALVELGRFDEGQPRFQEAIEGAARAGDRALEVTASIRLTYHRFYHVLGMSHGAFIEVVDDAEKAFSELGDHRGLAETLRMRGAVHVWGGRCGPALEVFSRALDHARRAEDRRLEMSIKDWIAMALVDGPTPAGEAIERIEDLLRGNEDDRILWWQMRRALAQLEAMRGRFDRARAYIREGNELARELGLEMELAAGQLRASGFVSTIVGDRPAAVDDLTRAVRTLERIGDRGHLASVAPDLAAALLAEPGREPEAIEMADLASSCAIEDDVDAQVRWRAAKARGVARLGELNEGERLARSAVERADRTDCSRLRALAHEALAEVLHLSGRSAEAAEALRTAIAVHEAKGFEVAAEADRRRLADLQAGAGTGDHAS